MMDIPSWEHQNSRVAFKCYSKLLCSFYAQIDAVVFYG